jgi:hypothetical protein
MEDLKKPLVDHYAKINAQPTTLPPNVVTFAQDLLDCFIGNNYICLFANQFVTDKHPLSMHSLAFKFAQNFDSTDRNFDNFFEFCSEQMRNFDYNYIGGLTKEQSKNPMWRALRYCRITASILHGVVAHSNTVKQIRDFKQMLFGARTIPTSEAMQRGENFY